MCSNPLRSEMLPENQRQVILIMRLKKANVDPSGTGIFILNLTFLSKVTEGI